jgi:hypothetical protein
MAEAVTKRRISWSAIIGREITLKNAERAEK